MAQGSGEARIEDAALVERARRGDVVAFGALVERYQDRVWRFLATWVREPEDREDLVQEVFLAAHRGIGRFRGEARFSTWLLQIALNQARGQRRRLARRPREVELPTRQDGDETLSIDAGGSPGAFEDPAQSPFDFGTGQEMRAKIWRWWIDFPRNGNRWCGCATWKT